MLGNWKNLKKSFVNKYGLSFNNIYIYMCTLTEFYTLEVIILHNNFVDNLSASTAIFSLLNIFFYANQVL